jgi:signal transduction histidine kinase
MKGWWNRGGLQARMARYIALAVVISLVVGTAAIVLYRHIVMRQALEESARRFAAVVRVPLLQAAEWYSEVGVSEIVEARVGGLLRLNRDVEEIQIVRGNGSLAFSASREQIRMWSRTSEAPEIDDFGLNGATPDVEVVAERVRIDGRKLYRVVIPGADLPQPYALSLIATFNYENVDRQLHRGVLVSLLALALGLVITERVSVALARGITRNLSDLRAGVRRIRAGRLDDRVTIESDDEIEELADAFNEMTDELQQTIGRLRQANRELLAIDEIKNDLVANVSHELRTPLTALKGYLELLDDGQLGPLDDKARRAVSVCKRNVDRLSLRVEDLVQLSQVEKAWPEASSFGPVNLGSLVETTVEMYQVRAAAKSLGLSIDVPDDLATVEGNEEQLERVLLNLVDNAVKFTPSGGQVAVSAEECDHEGRLGVLVRVVDSGIGIPASERMRIFDRFHQVDPSIRRRYGGMGLGLSLVHHTVETHGGVVWVESQEGSGSTFFLWLPCAEATP